MKVVLLDYGRVVAPEDGAPVVQTVYGALPEDRASSELFGQMSYNLARGLIDEDEIKDLLKERGCKVPDDYKLRWKQTIEEHMKPTREMTALVKHLKHLGHTVALLSNVWPLSEKIIRSNGWYNMFDKTYLSCALGMAKPDQDIYDYVLNDLNVVSGDILFVDDKERNLEYPRSIGMHTLRVDSSKDAVKKITEYFN